MRIAIIGAGPAGLASAKHVKQNGFDCDVFEKADQLGGTWVYTDEIEDKYGYPIYSAMYQNLRTNIPRELMGFPDFPIPSEKPSYLSQPDILEFLNQYTDYFELRDLIKLNCMVTDICLLPNDKWQLTYVYKPTKENSTLIYDAVIICIGNYNKPFSADIRGKDQFKGTIEHSHSFRSAKPYEGKNVLVIGAGPSGLDLTLQVLKVANKVYFSHHRKEAAQTIFPENVEHKPDVHLLNENTVEFIDESCCTIDAVILCTGYRYNFPFLHESCGITINNNYIQPLYKHMINIEQPTMCFIGIPVAVCAFHMFDLQVRFFCKYLNGSIDLPSADEMRRSAEKDMKDRLDKGLSKSKAHLMGDFQQSYYDELAKIANTQPIEPALVKLRNFSINQLYADLTNFREYKYKIIDRENFVKVN